MFSCSQTTSDSPAFDDDFMKSKTLETTIDLKKTVKLQPNQKITQIFSLP
jgi:cellobiose phosphorylase